MNILVPRVKAPFIAGGSDFHINGLLRALNEHGHNVDTVEIPFKFFPSAFIESLMDFCAQLDFNSFSGYPVDRLICLQFPAYYIQHDHKCIWLMHQHRSVYDLYDEKNSEKDVRALRNKIVDEDTIHIKSANKLFANSRNVANRLNKYNDIDAEPLYHPPFGVDRFYCNHQLPYIFYPSRHEDLKRQDLLIEALQYTKTPVKVFIAGDGGQTGRYRQMIMRMALESKVRLIGKISEAEKIAWYANCLAVFFGPYDEDYGYVTLEAMLSAKPVITCKDSGGPLEFVKDQETGFVTAPNAEEIAEKLDWLFLNPYKAELMGQNGRQKYFEMNITWDNVVEKLLS